MTDVNLTDVFVDYVCDTKWEDLDPVTIDRVKCRLIDSFGVLAIGHTSPDTDATVALLQKAGGAEESTVATYGSKIPMAQAAAPCARAPAPSGPSPCRCSNKARPAAGWRRRP